MWQWNSQNVEAKSSGERAHGTRAREKELLKSRALRYQRHSLILRKGKRQPTYEVAYALSKALDIDIEESLGIVYRSRCNQNEAREATLLRDLLESRN